MTRAEMAGRATADAIVEMVNLMYQNNTAKNFYIGLHDVFLQEAKKRARIKNERS